MLLRACQLAAVLGTATCWVSPAVRPTWTKSAPAAGADRSLTRVYLDHPGVGPRTMSNEIFTSAQEHAQWLASQSQLPLGFSVASTGLSFVPAEAPIPSLMNLTAIVLDEPTDAFGAVFTTNAFCGCPVTVGKTRLVSSPTLQAVVVNNKIANVRPGGSNGVVDCEKVCAEVASSLGLEGGAAAVFPSSTGVIGWGLPVEAMVNAIPNLAPQLQSQTILPAAAGIMTTDRYPKVRCRVMKNGARVVGIAKGAGMIEPHLATMLAFVLTDADVSRDVIRSELSRTAIQTFGRISIDSDESTSDTVLAMSSKKVPLAGDGDLDEFKECLADVCGLLAGDIVRNGEGTNHVMRVTIEGAPSEEFAVGLGRAVVNSPLLKTAIAGNDPNVGRLLGVVGKYIGDTVPGLPIDAAEFSLGGRVVYKDGKFALSTDAEVELQRHMQSAQLCDDPKALSSQFFPPHSRVVEIGINLRAGLCGGVVYGSDLTHDYVTINADYRS